MYVWVLTLKERMREIEHTHTHTHTQCGHEEKSECLIHVNDHSDEFLLLARFRIE